MNIFKIWFAKILSFFPSSLVELVQRMLRHRITSVSAEIAYFLLLSIFPFLICTVTLVGFFPIQIGGILTEFEPYMPQEVYTLINELIVEVTSRNSKGILSVGLLIGLWVSSKGMHAMIRSFDVSYEVREKRAYFKERLVAVFLTISFVSVIMLSFLLPIFGKQIAVFLTKPFDITTCVLALFDQLRYVASGAILLLIFMLLFYFGPNVRLSLRDAFPGALFTTIGWLLISYIFSQYVDSYANFSILYGSLGAIILLLLWFYMTGLLVLIGGEINAYLYASGKQMYQNLPLLIRYFLIGRKK